MQRFIETVGLLAGLVVVLAYFGIRPAAGEARPAAPVIVPVPLPVRPQPKSDRRRRPFAAAAIGEPAIDFPAPWWFKNIPSHRDRAGLCVNTSFELVARYLGLERFRGFRDWSAQFAGGSYAAKLAQQVKEFCRLQNIAPAYFDPERDLVQYEGAEPAFLETCIRNGWPCGCTLYHAPAEYGADPIYHCVVCVDLDERRGCLMDNNPVTKDVPPLLWAPRSEFLHKIQLRGQYWAFALVRPGPPPAPTQTKESHGCALPLY